MERRALVLVGGGGHCKSVIEAAESAHLEILGVLDRAERVGETLLGYPIIGGDEMIPQLASRVDFVITVGQIKSAEIRKRVAHEIEQCGGRLATIVASTAHVSKHATLGEGTVVLHGAVVNAGAEVGENCIINTLAAIEHDAKVGDFTHISTGVMVNGGCEVGSEVFVGSQSALLNGATICDHTIVAACSFVRKSIHTKGVYAGNPAQLKIKL